MSFTTYAPYLSPEYPKFTDSDDRIGNEYRYVLPDEVYESAKPVTGDLWEDGREVREHKRTPSLGNSGWSEVTISTIFQRTASSAGSELIDVRYRLSSMVTQVELCQHPDFLPGGPSDLYTGEVTSGPMTDIPLAFVMDWENEPVARIRAKRQFYRRDANGDLLNPNEDPIDVPAGAALAYVKLRLLGYSTYDYYSPVWEKISTYSGSNPPVSETWGQYIPSSDPLLAKVPPSVKAKYPQWIKTADEIQRVGNKARWERVERATGYKKVYFDVDQLNPAGNLFP